MRLLVVVVFGIDLNLLQRGRLNILIFRIAAAIPNIRYRNWVETLAALSEWIPLLLSPLLIAYRLHKLADQFNCGYHQTASRGQPYVTLNTIPTLRIIWSDAPVAFVTQAAAPHQT